MAIFRFTLSDSVVTIRSELGGEPMLWQCAQTADASVSIASGRAGDETPSFGLRPHFSSNH